jgi:hypothetical protein
LEPIQPNEADLNVAQEGLAFSFRWAALCPRENSWTPSASSGFATGLVRRSMPTDDADKVMAKMQEPPSTIS